MPYKNKEDQKAAAHRHYIQNKADYARRRRQGNKKIIERSRKFVSEYLSTHPCIDCGEDDPIVLEFDHVRGVKINNISNLSKQASSFNKLKAEIEKCEIRCANCHRRITYMRRLEIKNENKL